MQWYNAIMKRILSGIIFFLLPLFILVFVFQKAIDLIRRLILPFKRYLPEERVLGIGLYTLISLIVILFLCYLAGFLSEIKRIKYLVSKIEENLLVYVLGYSIIKSRIGEAITETNDEMRAVLVDENLSWRQGIEVEKNINGYSTIFFPGPPGGKSGQLKLVHESKLKILNISIGEFMKVVRKYGNGSSSWINDGDLLGKVKS